MNRFMSFLEWLFLRVVVPLFTVGIEWVLDVGWNLNKFSFPNRTVLLLAFILPVVAIRDVSHALVRGGLALLAVAAAVFFSAVILAAGDPSKEGLFLHLGIWLLAIGIIFGGIIEWTRLGGS